MTSKQFIVVGGVAALAVLLFASRKVTYPRWGRVHRQSGNRQ